ncbi:fimbria/pilus outer membrane usher protein [Salinicola rhizosphaerae]|uniref:Fimbriae protein n=1 Tax=Salinicola rhizosphaerae TaxID=1443141 RepID=A0ABQ3DWY0_9GAMM|nr:fimbria/pilus outer membrane usher protein [Salinicola rhizosphaerae]GHB13283.1 fimbriae protein [Salinicola rhizosphaerae]
MITAHTAFWLRSGVTLSIAACAAGVTPLAAQSLPPPPDAAAVTGQRSAQLYLELIVNQRTTGRVIAVRQQGEALWVRRDSLSEIALPTAVTDAAEIDLAALAEAQTRYDAVHQRLYLDVPSAWLPPQMLDARRDTEAPRAVSTPGALINYDLYTSHAERGTSYTSLWHELRAFGIGGSFSTTGRVRYRLDGGPGAEENDGYVRYDTTWRHFDQAALRTWEFGDVITRPLSWTRAVRLGGVQLSRNFAIRPDLITYPLPQFAGSTQVPTTVDLLVDGTRVDRRDIAPGPYTFADIPILTGAGEATLVTRDASGQQVVTTLPFYVTNELLKSGLSSYSVGAGALREDYAQRNFAYGAAAGDLSWRYGVSDWLTLGTHAEAAEDLWLGGLGATTRLWRLGVLELAAQRSHYQAWRGSAWSSGYEYRAAAYSFGVRWEERGAGFVDLSRLSLADFDSGMNDGAERRAQVTASASLGEMGSVAAGYFDIQGDDYDSRLLNLSWQRSLWTGVQLALTASREPGEDWAGLAQLTFSLPGVGGVASIGSYREATGETSQQLRYARAAPLVGGWGWDVGLERGDGSGNDDLGSQAEVEYRHRVVTASAGYYQYDDDTLYYGDFAGSVALMDNHLFAANEVRDAFVVVSTDGQGDIPVQYENQRVGVTDDDGYLLVPWGSAWYPGKYAINTLSLPPTIATSRVEQHVSVTSGSGYLLDFPLERHVATNAKLVGLDGEALPVGTAVVLPDGNTTVVGWDGMAYFDTLTGETTVEARLPQSGRCAATIPVDLEAETILQAGPVVCRPLTTGERRPAQRVDRGWFDQLPQRQVTP